MDLYYVGLRRVGYEVYLFEGEPDVNGDVGRVGVCSEMDHRKPGILE